eukprot:TRINITY_DN872_c0_g1_i3.p1 TRINITY_DN872_c0_g1~~TRINITY_DN872_c0_g1_i3.p1  ORF type:complete len:649 (-),score=86.26 TRINITY_DN872_c0_g1_i3:6-1952(-)
MNWRWIACPSAQVNWPAFGHSLSSLAPSSTCARTCTWARRLARKRFCPRALEVHRVDQDRSCILSRAVKTVGNAALSLLAHPGVDGRHEATLNAVHRRLEHRPKHFGKRRQQGPEVGLVQDGVCQCKRRRDFSQLRDLCRRHRKALLVQRKRGKQLGAGRAAGASNSHLEANRHRQRRVDDVGSRSKSKRCVQPRCKLGAGLRQSHPLFLRCCVASAQARARQRSRGRLTNSLVLRCHQIAVGCPCSWLVLSVFCVLAQTGMAKSDVARGGLPTLRELRSSDYAAVCHISKHVYVDGFRDTRISVDYLPLVFSSWLAQPHKTRLLGIEIDGKLAILAGLKLIDDGHTVIMVAMRVNPEFRRQGLLRLLDTKLVQALRDGSVFPSARRWIRVTGGYNKKILGFSEKTGWQFKERVGGAQVWREHPDFDHRQVDLLHQCSDEELARLLLGWQPAAGSAPASSVVLSRWDRQTQDVGRLVNLVQSARADAPFWIAGAHSLYSESIPLAVSRGNIEALLNGDAAAHSPAVVFFAETGPADLAGRAQLLSLSHGGVYPRVGGGLYIATLYVPDAFRAVRHALEHLVEAARTGPATRGTLLYFPTRFHPAVRALVSAVHGHRLADAELDTLASSGRDFVCMELGPAPAVLAAAL